MWYFRAKVVLHVYKRKNVKIFIQNKRDKKQEETDRRLGMSSNVKYVTIHVFKVLRIWKSAVNRMSVLNDYFSFEPWFTLT